MSTRQPADSFKRDTLYYLSHMRVGKGSSLRQTVSDLAKGIIDDGSVSALAKKSSSSKARSLAKGKKVDKKGGDFLKKVITYMQALVEQMAAQFRDQAAEEAKGILMEQIQEIVCYIMSSIVRDICDFISSGVSVFSNIKDAMIAAKAYFDTRDLQAGLNSGYPSDTVKAVRALIKKASFEDLGGALSECLGVGLNLSVPGVGQVLKAVKGIMTFVIQTFVRFRFVINVRCIVSEARKKWDLELYKDKSRFDPWFELWFPTVVVDVPVLACYVAGSNWSGGIYSFLATKDGKGKKYTSEQLVETNRKFETVQSHARLIAQSFPVKMKSDDALVEHGINTVLNIR